jgi:cell division septum initiation protein DivIVA
MSSAPIRSTTYLRRAVPILRRGAIGATWTVLLAVLAAGGAGLVGQAWHAPGSPARAELTYPGDAALGARLDAATAALEGMAADVERLADEAKTALAEVTSSDPTRLQDSLQRGGEAAASIEAASASLRASLGELPGGDPTAPVWYSNDALVRRSTILTAIDAAAGLAVNWRLVEARSAEAANLTSLIAAHDTTVLQAAAKGRGRHYKDAAEILDSALLTVAAIQSSRTKLIAGSDGTVLDEWIRRNATYDRALRALYRALVESGGNFQTVKVQKALRDEGVAREQLPPDRRTIIVIVSEVTRGGLTDAVVAIEDAQARIDDALGEAPSPAPGPSGP